MKALLNRTLIVIASVVVILIATPITIGYLILDYVL